MKIMSHRGFTLIELLIVVAIMGLMGALSASGYRSMRRGMEQSSVLRSASQFIKNAYQRAQIDRQPTAVFFWNEVRSDEEGNDDGTLVVVGRAVAVRTSGRISCVSGNVLVDEFGDLESLRVYTTDQDGQRQVDQDAAEDGPSTYIYRMAGSGEWSDPSCRSSVGQATQELQGQQIKPFLLGGEEKSVTLCGYYLRDGSGWTPGTSYGFEFAEMTLPNNYIFGTEFPEKVDADAKEMDAKKAMWFFPDGSGKAIQISAIRPGKGGKLEAQPLPESTEDPKGN